MRLVVAIERKEKKGEKERDDQREFAISRVRCANNKPLGLKGRGA